MSNVPSYSIEEIAAPFKALTELTLSNFEKVAKLNTDLSVKYANMYVDNVMSALDIKDQKAATEFANKQTAVMKDVTESLVADSKVYAELSKEFTEELQKAVSVEKPAPKGRRKAA